MHINSVCIDDDARATRNNFSQLQTIIILNEHSHSNLSNIIDFAELLYFKEHHNQLQVKNNELICISCSNPSIELLNENGPE